MVLEEQIEEGRRREALGGAWTSYVDGDSTLTEITSLEEGLERQRAEAELMRLNPYRDLIERIQNPTFEETFQGIFDEALDLLIERQRKYGPANITQLGLFGVFGRLADDKVERIRRALNGRVVNGRVTLDDMTDFADESSEDALFDIANYALIMVALKRGLWGRPLASEAG